MTIPFLHSDAQIHTDWQQTIDQAIESGREPLLELGMDRRLLYNLPLLRTFAAWQNYRKDRTQPLMLTGGADALWPVPLLYQSMKAPPHADEGIRLTALIGTNQSTENGTPSPPMQMVYGGADEATYLATLSILSADRLLSGTLYAVDLPAALQTTVHSHTQPHVHADWYALPLTLAHVTAAASTATQADAVQADLAQGTDDPWLAWAALASVVLLVALALFL